jgi:hypothetical protein
MASLESFEDPVFLEACISKKKSIQKIYEKFGIFVEKSSRNIWDPVFELYEADELHRRIIGIAKSFTSSPTNNVAERTATLLKPDIFATQIDDITQEYGERILNIPNAEFRWEREDHRAK